MSTHAPSDLPLQTLGDNGKPPAKRVSDANDAQDIVRSIVWSNRERARVNALVKGMIDGNAPYDSAKLKSAGQSYRCNVNFREGKSQLSSALVPYYDLFAGSQFYADVKLYLDNPDDQDAKSQIVTEEFDCLLRKYKAFEFNMNGVLHDFVAFGKGFVMFPNTWGWHFQRVNFNKVHVPDATEATVEKLELLVITENMQVHTLWNYIKDKDNARDAGWHSGAVAEAIRNALPDDEESRTTGTDSYMYVQQKMRDHDITEGTRSPTVKVAHLLVKEFDGKISHMIVERTEGASRPVSENSVEPSFLFEKVGQFEQMRHAVSAFFFETLDGSWNGASGLGHDIFSSMEIKNRVLCKTVDNGFLGSSMTLQAQDANGLQKASLTQIGNMNVLPPNFNVIQGQIFADSSGLIGVNQLLDQTISSNTGIFRAKMEKPAGNPRTAEEVKIQYQNATVLSNSGVSRFYCQLDPFYEELYRRVTKVDPLESDKSEEAEAVREFRRRCKKRGVTLEDMRSVESVRAFRNIGNGSQTQRTQALEEFAPYSQMLPESGKQAWMEDVVAAKFGPSKIARYVPPRDKQLLPNDQQAMALLENSAMKTGAPVAWTPTQNNVIHATEHLKAMAGAAQSLQQGGNPMEVLAFMEAAGSHTQIHMQKLSTDPSRKTEFKMLEMQFQKLAQFTDTLAQHLQDQQEAAAQQQKEQMEAQAKAQAIASGQDPEMQIKAATAAADAQLKAQKQAHAMALKEAQTKQKLTAADLKLAQTLRHQQAKTAQELQKSNDTVAAK